MDDTAAKTPDGRQLRSGRPTPGQPGSGDVAAMGAQPTPGQPGSGDVAAMGAQPAPAAPAEPMATGFTLRRTKIDSDQPGQEPFSPVQKQHKVKVGGIRVLGLTVAFLIVSIALCIGVGIEAFNVTQCYEALEQANNLASMCEEAVSQAGKTSDLLTAESRLFATTGNVIHAKNYFTESEQDKHRELSLKTIHENYDDPDVLALLDDAMQKSNDLMATEEYSMVLMLKAQGFEPAEVVPELANVELSAEDEELPDFDKRTRAVEILFNQQYAHDKGAIDEEVAEALDLVTASASRTAELESEGLESSITLQQVFITLLMLVVFVAALATIVLIILPLRANTKRLQKDERLELRGAYELRYLAQTYNDIYDFKRENEELLLERASRDALTGTLNRGSFDQALEEMRGSDTPICLTIIDVDNFKDVNDDYGHAMGDKVLCVVGELLMSRFRSTDIVARIGGDEFAVIAIDLPLADAGIMKLKIENIAERLANPRGDICPVTMSVGCAFGVGSNGAELQEQADQALYIVKESGRNGIAIYGEDTVTRL